METVERSAERSSGHVYDVEETSAHVVKRRVRVFACARARARFMIAAANE